MKVLFANKFFYLNGGSERVFFQERDIFQSKNIEIIDFSMQSPRNFFSPDADFFVSNIDFNEVKNPFQKLTAAMNFIHSNEAVKKIKQLSEKYNPDLAHFHNIYHQLTPSVIPAFKKKGVKTVLTLHDGKLICPTYLMLNHDKPCNECNGTDFWKPLANHCTGSWGNELLLSIEAYWHKFFKTYDYIDIFISPSQFLADLVSKRIPDKKVRVVKNGIDLNEYSSSIEDDNYAVYAGRLSKEKGIETLLNAYTKLKKTIPLKIAGNGPLADYLKQKYPEVEFLGHLDSTEMKNLLKKCSFAVVPSECYENCPMAVLETMAFGKPVIGSRTGGIPEQIDHGKNGLLFKMGDSFDLAECMNQLITKLPLRKELGRNARLKIEKEYSLESHCDALLEIYNELLPENKKYDR